MKFALLSRFFICKSLESIVIPKSVIQVVAPLFNGCGGLKSLQVAEDNPVNDSRNNCNAIVETATNTLVVGTDISTIPTSVPKIGYRAFYNLTIPSIVIPESVGEISDEAFDECYNLESITMLSSTPPSIGENAFYHSSKLTTIYVPVGAKLAYSVAPWNRYEIVEKDLTAVDAPVLSAPGIEVVYDLSGRRVAHPVKGIYIVNGRKVYIK